MEIEDNKEKIELSNDVIREVLPYLLTNTLHGVYGKAGCGKTTFCLHIVGDFLKKGKKVVYIDTENGFFIERLLDIYPEKEDLKNLLIKKVFDLNELRKVIDDIKTMITSKEHADIGLIVIDSLSNPYRVEVKDHHNIWEINRRMGRTIHELKKISFHHNIPILATHQVYVDFDTGNLEVVGRDLVKYDFKVMIFIDESNGKRYLKLVRHPFFEEREVCAVIKASGFKKKRLL